MEVRSNPTYVFYALRRLITVSLRMSCGMSSGEESVRFDDLRIASLLFTDYAVLFASVDGELQHSLQASVQRLG